MSLQDKRLILELNLKDYSTKIEAEGYVGPACHMAIDALCKALKAETIKAVPKQEAFVSYGEGRIIDYVRGQNKERR